MSDLLRKYKIETVSVCMLAIVISLVLYSQYIRNLSVPEKFRYIPPNASNLITTSALKEIWKTGTSHFAILFDGSDDTDNHSQIKKTGNIIRTITEEKCLPSYTVENLRELGLNTDRGLTFATVGPSLFAKDRHKNKLLVVLPVRDKNSFLNQISSSFEDKSTIKLKAIDAGNVRTLLIKRKNTSHGRLCGTQYTDDDIRTVAINNKPIAFAPDEKGIVELAYFPNRTIDSSLDLSCRAIFKNGSTGNCKCIMSKKDCSKPVKYKQKNKISKTYTINGKEVHGYYLYEMLNMVFPDRNTAVITNDESLLQTALGEQSRNLDFYRNWDSLIHDYSLLGNKLSGNEAVMAGAIRSPGVPVSTQIPILIRMSPDRIALNASLKVDNWNTKILNKLTSNHQDDIKKTAYKLTGAGASLSVHDAAITYYLEYLFNYLPEATQYLDKFLGDFTAVLEEMKNISRIDSIGIFLANIKQGIPEIVITADMEKHESSNLIFNLQKKFRTIRDNTIISAALGRYYETHPYDKQVSMKTLLTPTSTGSKADYHIQPEASDLWDNYKLSNGNIISAGFDDPKVFADNFYSKQIDKLLFRYITPPVTDNDIKYRLNNNKSTDRDLEALKNNKYRLQSVYLDNKQQLWTGIKASSIRRLIAQNNQPGSNGNAQTEKGHTDNKKLEIQIDPRWVINQGSLYPNRKINKFVKEYLKDLWQYKKLNADIYPRTEQNGLILSVELEK